MRILLVEDDAQMNEALKIFFCKAGYTVLQAYNATEAERCLNHRRVHSPMLAS